MSHTLTVNTARSNVQTALVAGIAQPYTPKAFPTLTFGETVGITLYLIDAAGSYDARSGAAGYTPRISVMLPTLQPTSGTFTIESTPIVDAYVVSGAGTSDVNGTYDRWLEGAILPIGWTHPLYKKTSGGSDFFIWNDANNTGKWYLSVDGLYGEGLNLYSNDSADATPPKSGWQTVALNADNPAPTVEKPPETVTADYNVSAVDLETALNAMNDGAGPFGDQCAVTKFADGTFSILFDTVGNKDMLTVSAGGIQPTSAASVLPLVEGDATTREEQLIRILAEPLVFEDSATEVANGWTMTLNANNANILRALAAEQGDMSANFSIDVISPTSTVDVVARGPVILKQGSFDVAALNGIEYPDFPTQIDRNTTTITDETYAALNTDAAILSTNSTINLAEASTYYNGYTLTINNLGATTTTLNAYAGQTVNDQAQVILTEPDESITIFTDGTNWNIA